MIRKELRELQQEPTIFRNSFFHEELRALMKQIREKSFDLDSSKVKHISFDAKYDKLLAKFSQGFFLEPRMMRFQQENLRLLQLHRLHFALFGEEIVKTNKAKKNSFISQVQFALLALAGTIFAICDGFDAVTSVLSLFGVFPYWLIFLLGFAFSLLSVVIFLSLAFVEISTNLDVHWGGFKSLLDVFVLQVETVDLIIIKIIQQIHQNRIRSNINNVTFDDQHHQLKIRFEEQNKNLESLFLVYVNLIEVQRDLYQERLYYQNQQNRVQFKIVTYIISIFSGILFFSTGFFAGQSLAVTILNATQAIVFTSDFPVMLTSIIVGLASFSIFWFAESQNMELMVSRWFGIEKDKFQKLPSLDDLTKSENMFVLLNEDWQERLEFNRTYATG